MRFLDAGDILYEDESILAVYKRAGIAVQHAGAGTLDLEHMVLNELANRKRRGGGAENRSIPYAAAVHRLDQPVEGIVLFAKTPQAAGKLGTQIQQGKMKKEYLAVVELPGNGGEPERGHLENALLRDGRTNRSRVVSEETPGARRAALDYELIERSADGMRGLMRIRLLTGRHHQIRVQFAHAGMPLCGDRKYNGGCKEEELALCACRLEFLHPQNGRLCRVEIAPRNPVFAGFEAVSCKTGKN